MGMLVLSIDVIEMSQDKLNYSIHPFIEEIALRACLALEVSNPALAQAVRPTMTTLSHYR